MNYDKVLITMGGEQLVTYRCNIRNCMFPADPKNKDYQDYLAWVAEDPENNVATEVDLTPA